jgi:hypothetical protein
MNFGGSGPEIFPGYLRSGNCVQKDRREFAGGITG